MNDPEFRTKQEMGKKKRYDSEELQDAVTMHKTGVKMRNILAKYPHIPRRTIYDYINRDKNGLELRKPGPKPILTEAMESDLHSWIVGMQTQGYPISRHMLLVKANEIYREMYGRTRSVGSLTASWIQKFLSRHPTLCLRVSQVIKRARAEVDVNGIRGFFWEVVRHVAERQLTADQVFNMDETAFGQQVQSKKVIAVKGSKNCWSKSANTSSHVTVVGCGSATGFMVPPAFITEGVCVNRYLLDSCCVEGSKVTVSAKGFMTASIFLVWLDHFSNSIPDTVKRPIVLVYDGYGSHFNEKIVSKAVQLKIILVLLPSNATHILQPLDVAVFKPFKTILKRHFEGFMIENATTTFSKKDMIQVASSAWLQGVVEREQNIIQGFETTGIWPLSFPNMLRRLCLFKSGGIAATNHAIEPWLQAKQIIRNDILSLPPRIDKKRKRRKTLDVNNRLLSYDQLQLLDE